MSDFNQGLMITLVGILTIFGVLGLLVFASEVLKRVLGFSEPNTSRQIVSGNKPHEASFRIVVDEREYSVDVRQDGVVVDGKHHTVTLRPERPEKKPLSGARPTSGEVPTTRLSSTTNSILAPMSGIVKQIKAKEGDQVQEGDVVLTIEVMKMEIEVRSDRTGKAERILVEAGQTVTLNEPLIIISS